MFCAVTPRHSVTRRHLLPTAGLPGPLGLRVDEEAQRRDRAVVLIGCVAQIQARMDQE